MLLQEFCALKFELEREPHSGTKITDIAETVATIEVASIDKCADVVGEAIFQTAANISIPDPIAIPGYAAANQDIGSEVQGADGITQEEISANGKMLGGSVIIVPRRFIPDTEVPEKEEVQAKASTRARLKIAPVGTKEMGVKAINLEFHITESAWWLRSDDRLYFFEGLPVACKGAAKRN